MLTMASGYSNSRGAAKGSEADEKPARKRLKIVRHDGRAKLSLIERVAESRHKGPMVPLEQVLEYARDLYQASIDERAHAAQLRTAVEETKRAYETTIESLIAALDARHSETRGHSRRAMDYAAQVCDDLAIDGAEKEGILRGALLHDVGKIGIPDAILCKSSPLTNEEWAEMQKHPVIGFNILKGIDFLESARIIVLQHHEWYDGSGYPGGLKGKDIYIGARIFAVVDAFDAMVSDRPYRKAVTIDEAIDRLIMRIGAQFDPAAVESFLRVLGR